MRVLWPNGSDTMPVLTSAYGPRIHPVYGRQGTHWGADFVGFETVRAVADGVVERTNVDYGFGAGAGYQVLIRHDGFWSRSCHLRAGSVLVEVGERVEAGDALGEMGMTGTATGVHLHFEISTRGPGNGVQIDPVAFLRGRITTGFPAGESNDYEEVGMSDITFIKDQLGGSSTRKTSLRQDVDEVIKRLKTLQNDVNWLKSRVGGTFDPAKGGPTPSVSADLDFIKSQVGGSVSRGTSLRQDVDRIVKKTGA